MNLEQQLREAAVDYVGFWARVLATLVDSVLIALVSFPLLYALYGEDYFSDTAPLYWGPGDLLINYLLPAIAVLLFWSYRSATPGKMLIRARIVDANDFGKPSTRQLVIRYLGYFVSGFVLGLGFLWIAFDRRKQGWHDKLARTVVIRR